MKRKKKQKTVYKTLRNKIWLNTLTLWLVGMFLLTWAVGADFYNQLAGKYDYWRSCVADVSENPDFPGEMENLILNHLSAAYYCFDRTEPLFPFIERQKPYSIGTKDWNWGKWERVYGFQAASAYYDPYGNLLFTSGDYLRFSYSIDGRHSYGYIDLETLEGGKELADKYISTYPTGDSFPFLQADRLQMTGYFEGDQFFPVSITTVYEKGQSVGQTCYIGKSTGEPLISILAYPERGYNYDPGSGFWVNGKYYDDPRDLLADEPESHFGLFGAVIYQTAYTRQGDFLGKTKMVLYCNPMGYAAVRMWPVYLISLVLVLVFDVRFLRRIRREVTDPLMVMVRCYEQNRSELSIFGRSPLMELKLLGEHFNYAQQERHKAENEVQQLRTALSYAENAEESRRKMVSAIAHELKTPLAVIHSYAEGLQEGIAPEKQEKYLSVILSESRKMDDLVQQMLDLSRLEAGKITLNTDQVDLAALTREIFEKLSLAAEARQLQVELDLAELSVVADEARIGQVITNFATNAVKYATEGGNIRVRLRRDGKSVLFSMENDAPHFSDEALEQVWETFYRADTARDRSGTGLGLAIAKNIVSLHRGSCKVRNTKTGVEFSFRLPL